MAFYRAMESLHPFAIHFLQPALRRVRDLVQNSILGKQRSPGMRTAALPVREHLRSLGRASLTILDDARHYRSTCFGKATESMDGYDFLSCSRGERATGMLPRQRTYLRKTGFCALLKLLSKLSELLFQVRDFILEPSDFFFQLPHSVAVNGTFQSVRRDHQLRLRLHHVP